MAYYIKANPKVAEYLNLENVRLRLEDGNYILWQADMTAFRSLTLLNETLVQIGAIALMPQEAKQEQDGTVTRPLPVATDVRFVMEEPDQEAEDTENVVGEGESSEEEDIENPEDSDTEKSEDE